jgi:hypothetical protein
VGFGLLLAKDCDCFVALTPVNKTSSKAFGHYINGFAREVILKVVVLQAFVHASEKAD